MCSVSETDDQLKGFIAVTFPVHLGIHSRNESFQGTVLEMLICVFLSGLPIVHSPKFIYR